MGVDSTHGLLILRNRFLEAMSVVTVLPLAARPRDNRGMSLESLLSFDTMTFASAPVTQDASGGATRPVANRVTQYANVPGRFRDLSAAQILRFMQLQMNVAHEFICQQDGIANGWVATSSDGRTGRVTGVQKIRGLGGIATFWKISLSELRPGA